MTTITLFLPLPVSVNRAYATVKSSGARVKSADANQWYNAAFRFAVPFIHQYQKTCDLNLLARRKYMTGRRGVLNLQSMKKDHPSLAYKVSYTYYFPDDTIRDVFNFEKLLTDLLVEAGFMLDDNFIVDGRVRLGKIDPVNPRAEIEIISLDREMAL